jgi:hypothetical protein
MALALVATNVIKRTVFNMRVSMRAGGATLDKAEVPFTKETAGREVARRFLEAAGQRGGAGDQPALRAGDQPALRRCRRARAARCCGR